MEVNGRYEDENQQRFASGNTMTVKYDVGALPLVRPRQRT